MVLRSVVCRAGIAACMMACVLLSVGGCQNSHRPRTINTTPGSNQPFEIGTASMHWPYWPVSMRIHPLTRVVEADGQLIIEARVEFADADGSTTRGVGQLRLMLIETAGQRAGTLVQEWTVDLRHGGTNGLHFDDITRTYQFRLELDPSLLTRTAQLRAHFLGADNARLSASHSFR